MFLKCSTRRKDGKEHRSWSIVESRRLGDGRCVQRHVLYLGEINDSQRAAWQKSIEVFEEGKQPVQMAIFPEDRLPQRGGPEPVVQIKLNAMELHRPRQWGGCWLALELWKQLGLDGFWREKLPSSREGTRWDLVLTVLVVYRLLDPGSEWRLHRHWFDQSALGDLLGQDFRLAVDDTLYRCHDKLLEHKEALFAFLKDRWRDLFGAKFEVLLYDLTSTYFECDVPPPPTACAGSATAGTSAGIASKWWWPSSSPRRVFPSATKSSRATPPTTPHCGGCSKRWRPNTARPSAHG